MRTALGLIGYPLSHSLSPQWFQEKFDREGLSEWTYSLMPLTDISQLPAMLKDHPDLKGFNVTIPYKQEILPYLDSISPQAERIGAVNTVLITDEAQLVGYNTDAPAFEESLRRFLGAARIEQALVLGNGGASRAVQDVLRCLEIPFCVVSRSSGPHTILYEGLYEAGLEAYQLIINTTPLGMSPLIDDCPPIPYGGLQPGHFLCDLIYSPEETLFLELGRMAGSQTLNGLEMLYLQAEKSWQIWTRK